MVHQMLVWKKQWRLSQQMEILYFLLLHVSINFESILEREIWSKFVFFRFFQYLPLASAG